MEFTAFGVPRRPWLSLILDVRMVTGLLLDVFILKLVPRKSREVDYMVKNPFYLKLLISLWNPGFLQIASVTIACLSTQQFQHH